MNRLFIPVLLFLSALSIHALHAQELDTWDNQLFVGNKIGWGKEKWRSTGELQFRVKRQYADLGQVVCGGG